MPEKRLIHRIKFISTALWSALISIISPTWLGITYMDLTGHGKGYGYDMGSESEVAVLSGVILLILWFFAFVPAVVSLCRSCYHYNKKSVWIPLIVCFLLFIFGIYIVGWDDFVSLFPPQ